MGKRLLNSWLKQPLLDVNEINNRLDMVQAFAEDPELRQGLRQQLKMISDIDRLTHALRRKSANLQPVVKLYHVFASNLQLFGCKDGCLTEMFMQLNLSHDHIGFLAVSIRFM
jgi:DNA mismatch repair ATPase MutS